MGASEFLNQTLWTVNFLKAQGFEVHTSEFHQDNQSAMKMEKNGHHSAGQESRHIHIRHFFIRDRIENGELQLIYCPTERMIGDYFSKPLQGSLFRIFRDVVMGIQQHSAVDSILNQRQEHVDKGDFEPGTVSAAPWLTPAPKSMGRRDRPSSQ